MALQEVTVQVNGSDHLTTVQFLDGVSYRLDFYTTKVPNLMTGTVAQCWYLDLYDVADKPLVLGIGLVTGIDILFPYHALAVPPGKLFVNPQTTLFIDPTVDTFLDEEAICFYQPEADVKSLGVSA